MVLADGSFVTASATSTPISSGRCAAAAATSASSPSFVFRLHPISTVYGPGEEPRPAEGMPTATANHELL